MGAEEGFSGVEHRVTPVRTEIVIKATKTKEVLGDKGRRIRELTSLVSQRWRYPEGGVQLFVERVAVRGPADPPCRYGHHALRHGVGRQGRRGARVGQDPRPAWQVHEVPRRLHAQVG